MEKTVLIADDEMLKLMTLKEHLTRSGLKVMTAADGDSALEILRNDPVDALVTDVKMPGLNGLSLLEKSKQLNPELPVLVMTGYGAIEDAVTAMRLGAEDYMVKPVSAEEIMVRLERAFALSRISDENRRLRDEIQRLGVTDRPVMASDGMKRVFEKLEMVAETDVTVLLVGETGAGKEVCARHLHTRSKRKDGPFVVLSCAALAPGVVESELFGHEKGAFTGAAGRREGRIHAANRGTLFLDDVDDIPLDVQAKLLRVLQDSTYQRVGGTETLKADVRFVAATKRDLSALVAQGKFRDDLMYRLSVVPVEIPPLRQRREEVPILAAHFLKKSIARLGRPDKSFSESAMETLSQHDWPGNVRELEHLIESLVATHPGEVIDAGDLPERIKSGAHPIFSISTEGVNNIDLEKTLLEFEAALLGWARQKSGGNQAKAAKMLGIPRSTFQYRMNRVQDTDPEKKEE